MIMIPFSQLSSYTDDVSSHPDWWVLVLIIGSVVIVFGVKFWRYFKSNKSKTPLALLGKNGADRSKALADWAQSKGLSPNPTASVVIAARYWRLSCLQKGEGHWAYNVMEGTVNNRKVCTFDYHYETVSTDKNGNRRVTHYYLSAVVVETDFQLKPLFIRTENVLDKIAKSAGLNDIDFESAEFNNEFYVEASDRRWAYDVVNQATMDLLLNSCRFNIEFNGKYVIAYRDELFELGHFDEALQLLTGIIDNLPKSLSLEPKGMQ
jgi:hypothetical protein